MEIIENKPEQETLQVVVNCIVQNNIEKLTMALENTSEEGFAIDKETLGNRCYNGKTLLDIVCMLGNIEVLKEFVKHGVTADLVTPTGYTALHLTASWGHLECLKFLIQEGVDIDKRTKYDETARHLAARYQQNNCCLYLDLIAAKQTLEKFIAEVKEKISDPEKMQGVKLSKEEKSTATNACNEKLEWIEKNPDAQVEDYLSQKQELEDKIEPIMSKQIVSSTPNTATSGKK